MAGRLGRAQDGLGWLGMAWDGLGGITWSKRRLQRKPVGRVKNLNPDPYLAKPYPAPRFTKPLIAIPVASTGPI